jgi:predicted nucleic acid-binding protein
VIITVCLVFDASAIIAFFTEMDDGEFLYALTLSGFSLWVTEGVVVEVKKEPGITRLRNAIKEKWITVKSTSKAEFDYFKIHYPMLDYAEIEVLQEGLELKNSQTDYFCILDEGPGRKIAQQLAINKTGTEGLLNRMNHLEIIDQPTKEKLLNKLNHSPFRRLKSTEELG